MEEKRHNIYICYHHCDEDKFYEQELQRLLVESNAEKLINSRGDNFGNIQPNLRFNRIRQLIQERFLRHTSVTVVLIGRNTWQRKHVDWEINASIHNNPQQSRSGLIGILLPTRDDFGTGDVDPFTLPPRLYDNMKCSYATLHEWSDDPLEVQEWIHRAFINRYKLQPDNSRPHYERNRMGLSWKP